MGQLAVPATGTVYVDANALIYRVELIEPYLTASAPLALRSMPNRSITAVVSDTSCERRRPVYSHSAERMPLGFLCQATGKKVRTNSDATSLTSSILCRRSTRWSGKTLVPCKEPSKAPTMLALVSVSPPALAAL